MVVDIEKFIYGGYGLSRNNGLVILTPLTLPKERWEIKESKKEKNLLYGRPHTLIKAHEQRVEACCPYYGSCGGCDLQHASYELQLQIKAEIFQEVAQRGKIELPNLQIFSSKPFQYRNRLRIRFNEEGLPSLLQKKSHHLCPISHCLCVRDCINEKLKDFWENPQPHLKNQEFQLFEDSDGKCQVVSVLGYGASAMTAFSQINNQVNEKLQNWIFQQVEKHFSHKINLLDLFCGKGNLSLPLLPLLESVKGYDLNKEAIREATSALATSDVKGSYQCSDLYRQLSPQEIKKRGYHLCIMDPPAAGLKGGAKILANSGLEHLIFISCSPPDLVRDLKELVKNYRIEEVALFDMFPQTSKIESGLWLRRK